MWWERFDAIDLYGGRITFIEDGGEDMFTVKFTDEMTVDVGSPDGGVTYCVTAVSSDDVEGWKDRLRHIAAHPEEAEAMGRRGRRLAEQYYNINLCGKEVANIIKRYET